MSEEKPTFKVTDRRLFNPDGSPRADIPRAEEQPAAAPPAPETPAAEQGTAGLETEPPPGMDDVAAPPGEEGPTRLSATADDEAYRPGTARSDDRESADPTPFANLVMFIASPAAAAMGMTEHPGLAPGEVDLPLAKHCIDLLAIVREKSAGNLSQQEGQIIDGLLAELRMQYVSLTSAPRPAAPPRGFTGGDITGGR